MREGGAEGYKKKKRDPQQQEHRIDAFRSIRAGGAKIATPHPTGSRSNVSHGTPIHTRHCPTVGGRGEIVLTFYRTGSLMLLAVTVPLDFLVCSRRWWG